MYQFKKDKFQKSRGGTSRVLDVCCEGCEAHIAYYQKDGPGVLKRMYVDRFIDISPEGRILICEACAREIGVLMEYKKEHRAAYRLYAGAVKKRIVKASSII